MHLFGLNEQHGEIDKNVVHSNKISNSEIKLKFPEGCSDLQTQSTLKTDGESKQTVDD